LRLKLNIILFFISLKNDLFLLPFPLCKLKSELTY